MLLCGVKKFRQAQASRAEAWRRQADNDLKFAKAALRDGFYAQCCFICQQASEKALKAILIARGSRLVLSHSLHDVSRAADQRPTAKGRQRPGPILFDGAVS
jgi:HEPN domain-containing protein